MASKYTKPVIQPDSVYNSVVIAKLINQIMRKGKKNAAKKVVYGAFDIMKEATKKDPMEVFDAAMRNAGPQLEIKPKRVGGATYQVPVEVKGDRKNALAIRWIIAGARAKKGIPMKQRLAQEFMDAANNTGAAVRKKENTHKMAEANRAFAHFAW